MGTAHDHDRALLDRLCLLRALYARRGDQDRVPIMSLVEAIRHAETLLATPAASSTPITPTTG
jgi:hypothetical protein